MKLSRNYENVKIYLILLYKGGLLEFEIHISQLPKRQKLKQRIFNTQSLLQPLFHPPFSPNLERERQRENVSGGGSGGCTIGGSHDRAPPPYEVPDQA